MNAASGPTETFLLEAEELLAQVEDIALGIQPGAPAGESVNRLFRVFHTIKGSGSMFGFTEVAAFTHHVETVLDHVREGALSVDAAMINHILAARDHIAALLAAARSGTPISLEAGEKIAAEFRALLPAPAPAKEAAPSVAQASSPEAMPIRTFRIFFRPNLNLMMGGTDPRALLDEIQALGTCVVTADVGAVPTLDQIQPDGCYLAWEILLTTDKEPAAIKDVFIFVEDGAELRIELDVPLACEASAAPTAEPKENVPAPTTSSVRPVASPKPPVLSDSENGPATKTVRTGGTKAPPVRVAAERLDLLVNLVGELVMTHSRIAQVAARANVAQLSTPVEDLERIVATMRDAVLGIRMMPIGGTFSRLKRLVHDLSAELGKDVELRTEGAETELDKTVLDQLSDPLIHLIRNSLDHAIEVPDERVRLGKPRQAVLLLKAAHSGSNVVVTIQDDGRGIDLAAVRAKAIEKHLITAEATLSEKEIINLIFLPGFSTAKQVTSVSGRGVGMDVVRRQIDALRGSIQISTRAGEGSSVALSLPLTLAIIEGQLVEIGSDQFIIPMSAVAENVELEGAQRSRTNGRNVVAVRGELVPYIRLRELFGIGTKAPAIEMIVIVNHEGQRVGLVVDRVLGSHQTVIQSLGCYYRQSEVTSGGTIMGDGRVALILDLAGLVRAAERTRTASPVNSPPPRPVAS